MFDSLKEALLACTLKSQTVSIIYPRFFVIIIYPGSSSKRSCLNRLLKLPSENIARFFKLLINKLNERGFEI